MLEKGVRPKRGVLSPRVLKFAAVGLSGVPVNLGVLYLLADVAGIATNTSSVVAIELSILWNFVLNNAVTFSDRNQHAQAGFFSRMARYNLVGLVGLAIQFGTFFCLNKLVARVMHVTELGLWKYGSQLVGIGVAMAWNFVSNFFWTWNQRPVGGLADEQEAA
jgi:putative flippase GtrA